MATRTLIGSVAYNNRIARIFQGDNVAIMREMRPNCIDLTVTSPPYDDLRQYDGYSFDFENVARELYRVTKPGGVVVWVVADKTKNGSETGTSFRQALFFKEIGFNLYDTMIYMKTNAPPLTHRRYEQAFEYMFALSKCNPKTFNGLRIEKKYASRSGTFQHTSNGVRANANTAPNDDPTRLRDNVWAYTVGRASGDPRAKSFHPAPFPDALARDHILSWSNTGDLVFDPFVGSGTTLRMALENGRDAIGIDISRQYAENAYELLRGI